ncbi:copper resistance protein CopC [Brachybacterium muris]|uniref:copper resistance CopC family protein n=1 Tax=Brachybacterium muris TaxID=219301 RepID=UPI0021A8D8F6|nr:copper resistance protein CopC [Brachybacterium muris]
MRTTTCALPATPARRSSPGLPVLLAVLATVLLGAAMLLAPAPAHAHDSLISSDPADGATLETSPEQITLTYSAEVLEVSPVVQISAGESGEPVELTPVIDGPAVTAEIPEPLAAGTHTVQWRVVSSDGHPIEGSFTFTVETGPEPTEDQPTETADTNTGEATDTGEATGTGTGTGEATASASESATASAAAPETTAPETGSVGTGQEEGADTLPLLLGVVGVAVLGVALAAFFALRRR